MVVHQTLKNKGNFFKKILNHNHKKLNQPISNNTSLNNNLINANQLLCTIAYKA